MTELGNTSDPKALIPGDPDSVHHTESALRAYGDLLHIAGAGLQRIDTSDGWSGDAADAFRKVFHGQPGKWLQAGDAFHDAAAALDAYTTVLGWAQGQAADAINLWNSGAASQQAARDKLDSARNQLVSAARTAAAIVGKARDLAPPKPGFWSQVGDDIGGFFSGAGHFAEQVGETALTDLASVGNAIVHDPGSVAETGLGLGLAALGAGGEVGGFALDATGIGLVIGVPTNVVSAGAIATGLGMAGLGMTHIANDAAGPDRVNMNSDGSGGSSESAAPRSYQSNPGSIGQDLGYSRRQVNDAIHAVKGQGGWRGIGGNKNPDVVVDTSTGEVYPKLPDGSPADDSIGNIFDYLPEE
ncbi:hypothetical protein OG455_17745 [Kitasatospora sp. NBC_01287]|uniref:putative T7SS-secreted protein n=1 Tax=Kitasatospora sp. NBC_01287 TaxID=2903573 RepID=UPI0022526554|nr:hypothetical protein [Kitasatospora sp. NBC_01287]MCX4747342.1 hypothetical protein [Kitasatospora sp. NBC_01287]